MENSEETNTEEENKPEIPEEVFDMYYVHKYNNFWC